MKFLSTKKMRLHTLFGKLRGTNICKVTNYMDMLYTLFVIQLLNYETNGFSPLLPKSRKLHHKINYKDLNLQNKKEIVPNHSFDHFVLQSAFQDDALTEIDESQKCRENFYSAIPRSRVETDEAMNLISNSFFPSSEYNYRMKIGHKATLNFNDNGDRKNNGIYTNNDERLTMTYAEFPITSFQILIEKAQDWMLKETSIDKKQINESMNMIDLGSGCGKLIMYASLIWNDNNPKDFITDQSFSYETFQISDDDQKNNNILSWNVHGIEISEELHKYAVQMLQRGEKNNIFEKSTNDHLEKDTSKAKIYLHNGPAATYPELFQNANIIFSYSSVLKCLEDESGNSVFLPDIGGLILAPEWSQMLSKYCQKGCIVVTTDRALNPMDGWRLLERLDVENPDLFGSTAFIQILEVQN